jgi:hypothetical protein
MAEHKYQEIPVEDLLLDVTNPRHEAVQDQGAAIRALTDGPGGEKLLRLAQDITTEGTNPADLPIVVPSEAQGKYTVVEGNRRVACLRLLSTPALLDLPTKRTLKKQFEKLAKEIGSGKIDRLPCMVFDTRQDASHWIELRHTGERGGVGIVKWSAGATARFSKGQSWMALEVAEFVKQKAALDATARHQIDKMSLTNLARLVNDPSVREAVGITPEGGEIKSTAPEDQVLKTLTKIVMDVADKTISVNNIRSKDDRTNYIEGLAATGAIPRSIPHTVSAWKVGTNIKGSVPRRGRPPITKRKAVIPSPCVLRIKNRRLNAIYRELKRIDADAFPNSAGVMLRVFLELSLDRHISAKKLRGVTENSTLNNKLLHVSQDLETSGNLTAAEAQAIRVAAGGRGMLFSIDTLHAYVHNKFVLPKGPEIRDTWDQMQRLLEEIWP